MVHSEMATVAYFTSLVLVRGCSSKAPTLGTLPAAEVGLVAAPTGVRSAWEVTKQLGDGMA
jgi:hypothetical protein